MATQDSSPEQADLPLPLLLKLSGAERDRFLTLLQRARSQRAAEHEAAIEAAMRQVPALLRGTLRRRLAE